MTQAAAQSVIPMLCYLMMGPVLPVMRVTTQMGMNCSRVVSKLWEIRS
uniref:Uncharacterized protein n=1 Tax=Microplitis mediator bracovirus TaxID=1836595 RepID=A0A2I6SGV2_9VIRU|nr:hypothetical protein MmBV_CMP7 [Microplitis mediator bracovirus]